MKLFRQIIRNLLMIFFLLSLLGWVANQFYKLECNFAVASGQSGTLILCFDWLSFQTIAMPAEHLHSWKLTPIKDLPPDEFEVDRTLSLDISAPIRMLHMECEYWLVVFVLGVGAILSMRQRRLDRGYAQSDEMRKQEHSVFPLRRIIFRIVFVLSLLCIMVTAFSWFYLGQVSFGRPGGIVNVYFQHGWLEAHIQNHGDVILSVHLYLLEQLKANPAIGANFARYVEQELAWKTATHGSFSTTTIRFPFWPIGVGCAVWFVWTLLVRHRPLSVSKTEA